MAEILFEYFEIDSLNLTMSFSLALAAIGKTSGLIVDIGDGVTSIAPICEGYPVGHAIKKCYFSGSNLTDHMINLIEAENEGFNKISPY